MATGTQFPVFNQQFWDTTGATPVPAAGYFLYQYAQGTDDNQNTYQNVGLSSANTHPIILDAAGKCTLYADPELAYTFVLTTADDIPVDDWDSSSIPLPAEGDFVEISGDTMEGPLILEADPTELLGAATKQYVDDAIIDALATMTDLVDAATAAAADATAAAAAVKPTIYTLSSATGASTSRSVYLSAGTWEVVLETRARLASPAATPVAATVTQGATVDSCTVGTSIAITKAANDTQTTNVSAIAVGSLVVSTPGNYTMSMAAVVLASQTSQGSTLTVSLQ
jgi:hypothetical protein